MLAATRRSARDDAKFTRATMIAGLGVVLACLPVGINSIAMIWPLSAMWAAVGWGMGRLSLRAVIALTFLGLLQDALCHGPIGPWILANLAAYGATRAMPRDRLEDGWPRAVAPVLALVAEINNVLSARQALPKDANLQRGAAFLGLVIWQALTSLMGALAPYLVGVVVASLTLTVLGRAAPLANAFGPLLLTVLLHPIIVPLFKANPRDPA